MSSWQKRVGRRGSICSRVAVKRPEIATILGGGGHVDRAEIDGQSWVWVRDRMNISENSYPSSQGQKEIKWKIRIQISEGTNSTPRPLC